MNTSEKYQKRRLEIMISAAAAFRRSGYHGASVESIARELQMHKGNLYYYFKDKEEILFLCHDYSLDLILNALEEVEASALPPEKKLHEVIVALVHTIVDVLQGTTLILDLEALSPRRLQKVIGKRDKVEKGIRCIIEAGIEAGVFRKTDPKLINFVIFGAVNWIPRWFHPQGTEKSDEIGQLFADYLIAGLLNEPAAIKWNVPKYPVELKNGTRPAKRSRKAPKSPEL